MSDKGVCSIRNMKGLMRRQETAGLWPDPWYLSSEVKFKLCPQADTPRSKLTKLSSAKAKGQGPIPEVKEDVPVCTQEERLLGGQKGRGPHPIISVDMHP